MLSELLCPGREERNKEHSLSAYATLYLPNDFEAEKNEIKSIAFPAISTGAYGFPIERACRIAIWEMRRNLEDKNAGDTIDVIAVCFNQRTFQCYQEALQEL